MEKNINKKEEAVTETPKDDFKTLFGKNLRYYRIKKGYKTAKSFANALFLAETTYISYENGKRSPDIERIEKICELLNITPNDLWYDLKKRIKNYIVKNFRKVLESDEDICFYGEVKSGKKFFFTNIPLLPDSEDIKQYTMSDVHSVYELRLNVIGTVLVSISHDFIYNNFIQKAQYDINEVAKRFVENLRQRVITSYFRKRNRRVTKAACEYLGIDYELKRNFNEYYEIYTYTHFDDDDLLFVFFCYFLGFNFEDEEHIELFDTLQNYIGLSSEKILTEEDFKEILGGNEKDYQIYCSSRIGNLWAKKFDYFLMYRPERRCTFLEEYFIELYIIQCAVDFMPQDSSLAWFKYHYGTVDDFMSLKTFFLYYLFNNAYSDRSVEFKNGLLINKIKLGENEYNGPCYPLQHGEYYPAYKNWEDVPEELKVKD